ncbi:MAG: sensor histidine kinase, partial [Eubacterium sp.]|nr:sensor histidine kinase [Eubacterium sp.]
MSNWEEIKPKVNEVTEFMEIAGDFGDPMEIFREALHNAYDWHAKTFSIDIRVEDRNGVDKLIIELKDDGDGMTKDQLTNNFWDLGNSASKGSIDKIGEKGHGTKIYLRSEKIIVRTSDGEKAYESVCDGPFGTLNKGDKHIPKVRDIKDEKIEKGTTIIIEGYNNNNMEIYTQDVVKDYLYWKTVLGSFMAEFDGVEKPDFRVLLKALDVDEFEELEFGHIFAEENHDIEKLKKEYNEDAADHFVKKYMYQNQSLDKFPHIKYDVVIYVEGDAAKKEYNPLLRKRKNPKKGSYKVSDRYGLYLSKDYIPIQRVNEWVTGFGTGSNSVVMLHGFINCQKLRLTANRGSIANTNPEILNELKKAIDDILDEIEIDLYDNNIDEIKRWQEEIHTKEVEEAAFKKRKKLIETKR